MTFGFSEDPELYPPAPVPHPANGDDVDEATFQLWLSKLTNRTANLFRNSTGVRAVALGSDAANITEAVIELVSNHSGVTNLRLANASIGQTKLLIFGCHFDGSAAVVNIVNHLNNIVATITPVYGCSMRGVGVLIKTSSTNWQFKGSSLTWNGMAKVAVAGTGGDATPTIFGQGDIWLHNSDVAENPYNIDVTIDAPRTADQVRRIHLSKQKRGTAMILYKNGSGAPIMNHSWGPYGVQAAVITLLASGLTWEVASITTDPAPPKIVNLTTYPGTGNYDAADIDVLHAQFSVPNLGVFNVTLPSFSQEGREFTVIVRTLFAGGQVVLREGSTAFAGHFAAGFERDSSVLSARYINGHWRTSHSSSLPESGIAVYDGVAENS